MGTHFFFSFFGIQINNPSGKKLYGKLEEGEDKNIYLYGGEKLRIKSLKKMKEIKMEWRINSGIF
jgi:hypothetical protein